MAVVRYTPYGQRALRALPPDVAPRIEAAIRRLADGRAQGEPLSGRWRGLWRLRLGDWRIIYALPGDDVVVIHGIGHRRDVYRQRR